MGSGALCAMTGALLAGLKALWAKKCVLLKELTRPIARYALALLRGSVANTE
jgi:hypothetical protein